MKEVYDFLVNSGAFFLATVDGDKPRVRPIGAVNIYEDKLYFMTGKVKRMSKQLNENSNVEICALIGDKWLRVEGKLIKDDRREARLAFLEANPELAQMYSADDGNMEVMYFKDAIATFCSFTEKPRILKF